MLVFTQLKRAIHEICMCYFIMVIEPQKWNIHQKALQYFVKLMKNILFQTFRLSSSLAKFLTTPYTCMYNIYNTHKEVFFKRIRKYIFTFLFRVSSIISL